MKRAILVCALLCVALTGCTLVPGTTIGTGGVIPPNNVTTTVTVIGAGVAVPGVTVTESSGFNFTTHTPTGIIATQVTNSAGQAQFFNANASQQLCFSATFRGTGGTLTAATCFNPVPTSVTLSG